MSNWISVEDRLPEKEIYILYYFDVTGVGLGKFDGLNTFYSCMGWLTGDVTHWQPLPEPPKEQDNE